MWNVCGVLRHLNVLPIGLQRHILPDLLLCMVVTVDISIRKYDEFECNHNVSL